MYKYSLRWGDLGRVRVFQHRLEPDELTTKHLAMLGSATLILVHSVRHRYASSNTVAGTEPAFLSRPPCRALASIGITGHTRNHQTRQEPFRTVLLKRDAPAYASLLKTRAVFLGIPSAECCLVLSIRSKTLHTEEEPVLSSKSVYFNLLANPQKSFVVPYGTGLLIGEPNRAPGHVKSLILLLGRFALTVLFITVGINQVKSRGIKLRMHHLKAEIMCLKPTITSTKRSLNPTRSLYMTIDYYGL